MNIIIGIVGILFAAAIIAGEVAEHESKKPPKLDPDKCDPNKGKRRVQIVKSYRRMLSS